MNRNITFDVRDYKYDSDVILQLESKMGRIDQSFGKLAKFILIVVGIIILIEVFSINNPWLVWIVGGIFTLMFGCILLYFFLEYYVFHYGKVICGNCGEIMDIYNDKRPFNRGYKSYSIYACKKCHLFYEKLYMTHYKGSGSGDSPP